MLDEMKTWVDVEFGIFMVVVECVRCKTSPFLKCTCVLETIEQLTM